MALYPTEAEYSTLPLPFTLLAKYRFPNGKTPYGCGACNSAKLSDVTLPLLRVVAVLLTRARLREAFWTALWPLVTAVGTFLMACTHKQLWILPPIVYNEAVQQRLEGPGRFLPACTGYNALAERWCSTHVSQMDSCPLQVLPARLFLERLKHCRCHSLRNWVDEKNVILYSPTRNSIAYCEVSSRVN
jgi:hypothetical protein